MTAIPAHDPVPPAVTDWFIDRTGPVDHVHDADTVEVPWIDLGGRQRTMPPPVASGDPAATMSIRLLGIAARELRYPDAFGKLQPDEGGYAARDALNAYIYRAGGTHRLWIRALQPDKYVDPVDAIVWREGLDDPTGPSVNDWLVQHGWAVPWDGRGTQPKPAWPRVPQQGIGYQQAARKWKVGA